MKEVVNERSFIEKILRVKAALATAQGELEVIPKNAAEEIAKKASIDYIDMNKVKERLQKTRGISSLQICLSHWSGQLEPENPVHY